MKHKRTLKKTVLFLICFALLGFFRSSLMVSEATAVEKIRIPVLGPMKFHFGKFLKNAGLLTADLINKQGGVDVGGVKHEIELVIIDDNDLLSITDAVNAMERAVSIENANFIISGSRTESTLAMMDIAADNKKIFLDANSVHPNQIKRVKENYDRYKYFFRVSYTYDMSILGYILSDLDYVAQLIKKELGVKKVRLAVMLDKAAYAEPFAKIAKPLLTAMGFEWVGMWRPSYAAKDLFAEVSSIKAGRAQLILAVMSGGSGQAFVNAWAKLKVPAAITGTISDAQREAFWQTTGGAANYVGSYNSLGRVEMSSTTIDFYDRYKKRFGDQPGWNSPYIEAALWAIKGAVERAGTLDPEKVIPELEKTDIEVAMGRLKFYPKDSNRPHQAIYGKGYQTLVSFQWRDGKQLVYYPAAAPLNKVILAKSPSSAYLADLKYKGTMDYVLPPWMIKYWKNNR